MQNRNEMESESVYQAHYHKKNTHNAPLVILEKFLDAPLKSVFDACSKPELLKQWWGPETFTAPAVEMDSEVGGHYLACMESPDGETQIWSAGEILEIIPNRRIVVSQHPANKKGEQITAEEAGDGPFADSGDSFITYEFEEISANQTKLTLSHEGLPARKHEECVDGWSSSLDKLKRLVEKH